ncbi:M48 family metalloprotease [Streptomyces longhuiensis]|uniref:M48 family metalloprotease n=1 Tax=Streptomyces longhuiensis TaxID=2880933 RepID=UPI001D09BE47|nr:M48 family metalloprotease [Streptomyces longhuiensis]UDM04842.1 M48 family metalloprotease [Streptomyces longhuiensis]
MSAGRRAPQRPDERVLVSGTTLRFAVLVVLILVSSAWMSLLPLAAGHTSSGSTSIGDSSGCDLAAGGDPGRIGGPVPQEDTSAYRTCIDKVSSPSDPSPWLSAVWPLLVVAAAAVLMWAIPAWKARRSRVVPLEAVDPDGEIHAVLRQLSTVAGLDHLPRVIVDPAAVSGGAVVFGSNRRPTIRLHGGLIVRRHTDPERFRAVVLHEYAHIRNGDITLTYLTVALWRAFLGLVLLPYLAVLLTLAVWMALFFIGVRAPLDPEVMRGLGGDFPIVLVKLLATPAILAVLVHLSRADVLRTRETYADLAAVRWGADPRIWTGAAHLADTSDSGPRRTHRALLTFREAWRTHPRGELRQESLSDPAPLYAARALPMFLTGVLAPLLDFQLSLYGAVFHLGWLDNGAWALSAVLVAGVAGTALWRAAINAVFTGRRPSSGARAGLWLGAGMAAGELAGYRVGLDSLLPAFPPALLLPVCAGAFFGWWTTQCARLWSRTWPGTALRPVLILGVLVGSVLLSSWFAWWQGYGVTFANGLSPSTQEMRQSLTNGAAPAEVAQQDGIITAISTLWPPMTSFTTWPLTLVSVALLWLTPLAAWAVRFADGARQRSTGAAAKTADRLPEQNPLPPLGQILLPGLLGGILATCVVAGSMAYMHTWPPPSLTARILLIWTFLAWVFIALLTGAAVAGTTAAVRGNSHRLLWALIAAQIAVLVGLAGTILVTSLDGCVPQLSTLRLNCQPHPTPSTWLGLRLMVGPVLVLAVPVAAIATAAVTGIRRIGPTRQSPPPPYTQPQPLRTRLVLAVLGVMVTVITLADLIAPVIPHSTPSDARLTAEARNAGSPRLRALQVYAWEKYGGLELARRYVTAQTRMKDLLLKDPRHIDESEGISVCRQLQAVTRDAADYFPVPDARAQVHWNAFVTGNAQGSRNCMRALKASDGPKFLGSVEELTKAMHAYALMRERNDKVMRAGGLPERS